MPAHLIRHLSRTLTNQQTLLLLTVLPSAGKFRNAETLCLFHPH